jgi:uroporphyrin-3 C-methyltransferase
MTEPTIPAADDTAPTAGAPASSGAPSGAREVRDAASTATPPRRAGVAILWIAVIALAAALALEWYDSRDRIASLRDDTAARVRESAIDAREAVASVKEMRESLRELQARVGAAEARLAESRSREVALDAMYQELARGRDDWLLAETEQTVQIAAQQLQLARNVPAALAALQTVDARLARTDRPEFASLRGAIAADIQRLKNAPSIDVGGLTSRIDRLIDEAERLPLRSEERPAAARPRPVPESGRWWERWMAAAWAEIKSLVRIERIDVADPRLLAPEHAYFLRENLKLRLLHARVALIQRNEATFRGDLKQAREWLTRYFDPRDKSVADAQATLAQLDEAALRVELPTLADSLGAVRRLRQPREGR